MIHHQRQGHNECLITSIAVLMDIDREKLLALARKRVADKPWDDYSDAEKGNALHAIKEAYGSRYPAWLNIEPAITLDNEIRLYGLDFIRFNVDHFRGAMTLACPYKGAHIVTYEYGIVIDSSMDCPLALEPWAVRWAMIGFRVIGIYCDFDTFRPSE